MSNPLILNAKNHVGRGIKVTVLGDSGPFSIIGKSICYLVETKGSEYMLDVAAPIFQLLGTDRLNKLNGVFVTHTHDDHKRTFTDFALYYMYSGVGRKLRLITTEDVHREIRKASVGALETSLSVDSKRITNVPYKAFIDQVCIGPRARANIRYREEENGIGKWVVVDENGALIGPERAKLFFQPEIDFPRLLYKDPSTGLWIEPVAFYAFTDMSFYLEDRRDFVDESASLSVRARNSPSWHGLPATSYRFSTETETLTFSSDTVYNLDLWRELAEERMEQKLGMSSEEFEAATVIRGDINDYIECMWSQKRFEEASRAYDDSAVIHDVADLNSVVHTDYPLIASAPIKTLILTHSPDDFISVRPLSGPGKNYRIIENELFTEVDGMLYPEIADVYIKKSGVNYIGIESADGIYSMTETNGILKIHEGDQTENTPVMKVDLYCDIGGGYYPLLNDPREEYFQRPDRKVIKLKHTTEGSSGSVIKNLREELTLIKMKK